MLPHVCWLVHGNDFVFVGAIQRLKLTAEHIAKMCKVKVGSGDQAALRVLHRSKEWARKGIVYASDHPHADRLIELLQFTKGHVTVTPALRESRKARRKQGETRKEDGAGSEAHPRAGVGESSAGGGVE